jgi:hypothetical protein
VATPFPFCFTLLGCISSPKSLVSYAYVLIRPLCVYRQSHQELEGFAGRVRVTNSMTLATALRSHKLLGLLKKRSLTN